MSKIAEIAARSADYKTRNALLNDLWLCADELAQMSVAAGEGPDSWMADPACWLGYIAAIDDFTPDITDRGVEPWFADLFYLAPGLAEPIRVAFLQTVDFAVYCGRDDTVERGGAQKLAQALRDAADKIERGCLAPTAS